MTEQALSHAVYIRSVVLTDLEAVRRLDLATFGQESYPKTFLRQAFDLWPALFLVAVSRTGAIAGYGMGALAENCSTAWILALSVDWQMRHRGIGTNLTLKLLDSMSKHGATEVRLTTSPRNAHALSVFRGIGFQIVGHEEEYFGEDEPRYILSLNDLESRH